MEDILELIFKRRSIRIYDRKKLDKETITKLMQAAMAGPSAVNAQPWEFVVITEKEVLDKLRLVLPFAKMAAPAAICVLGSSRRQRNKAGDRFWVQDCSASTENILLAATSLGLGSVWIGVHPITLVTRLVKDILNLPDGVIPLNLILLGYPAEEPPARTQYDESRVQWGPFPKEESKTRNLNAKPRRSEITVENDEEHEHGHR